MMQAAAVSPSLTGVLLRLGLQGKAPFPPPLGYWAAASKG